MVINRCKCSGVILSKTQGENMFLFVHAKPFMSEYNKIERPNVKSPFYIAPPIS
jgi:hypothetical protein